MSNRGVKRRIRFVFLRRVYVSSWSRTNKYAPCDESALSLNYSRLAPFYFGLFKLVGARGESAAQYGVELRFFRSFTRTNPLPQNLTMVKFWKYRGISLKPRAERSKTVQDASKTRRTRLFRREFTNRKRARKNAVQRSIAPKILRFTRRRASWVASSSSCLFCPFLPVTLFRVRRIDGCILRNGYRFYAFPRNLPYLG